MGQRWCLGFIIDKQVDGVVLLRKSRHLHVGMWNGIGGSIEKEETSLEAMIRECQEETKVSTSANDWWRLGTLSGVAWTVDLFAAERPIFQPVAYYPTDSRDINSLPDDTAYLVPFDHLPDKLAPHVYMLAHRAREKLRNPTAVPAMHFSETL